MGQIQNLGELYSLIRRHILMIVAIFVLGTLLAAVYAKTRPDVYESTAVIQVETSEVVRPGQGASGARACCWKPSRRLTTRDALLELAARQGVLVGVPLSDDQKVALLRQSIRFQPIYGLAAPGSGSQNVLSALAITTGLSDPEQAARVSNDLAQTLLDGWTEAHLTRSRTALDFFRAEEARLWGELGAGCGNRRVQEPEPQRPAHAGRPAEPGTAAVGRPVARAGPAPPDRPGQP
ncbi:MAG: hypothetical protein HZT43_20135 [Exiguobacterium profundum]|nr:MAG: hypothetical protein HZT43_20135 [Exiguobacterium profundum]